MRVAERTLEPGATLLLHEFFEVNVKDTGRRAETQVYQATEFAVSGPAGVVMVKGVYYAEARKVLGYRTLRGGQHTYDAQESSSDADIMLREGCPELVRISNCVAWFDMAALTDGKPKVVHPEEVKERGATVAGKAQHYICGAQAMELDGGGFSLSPLAREELVSSPEERVGYQWASVTATWATMDDLFERARAVLRDGNGLRSGTFELQWGMAELRFWNQVSDTKEGDWSHTMATRLERRFDASFNYQQLSRDVHRQEITYRSKSDFKRIQFVSGIFGLVAVRADTEQGGDNIMRFKTGTNLRVCTSDVCLEDAPHKGPGAMIPEDYWKLRAGHHGTFRMRYDREKGKRWGKLTVRLVWHEITYNDVEGFEDKYLIVR